jgi:asparagine synthase (glutamine-hydrolysing)
MCGIVGFISSQALPPGQASAILSAMTDALSHRGPDAEGRWNDPTGRVHLGHRRLAIIDLTPGGAQPMHTPDCRGVIVFNGEIYNFPEIKVALEAEGIPFSSRSDTEVLLAALHHWGVERTLPKLNGMFAFAYWDARSGSLYLARDRIGEKPLYYSQQGGRLFFSSELKALRAHPEFSARMNDAALPHYLRFNYIPSPLTILEQTWKLPPAHWTRFDLRTGALEEPQAYWSVAGDMEAAAASPLVGSLEELSRQAEELLLRSVKMRLNSDRPVGCFLSGGIDSSTIASLMAAVAGQQIQTFTIGYGHAAMNEAEDAEAVARHLGTAHTTFVVQSPDVMDLIPQLAYIYDEPYADSSQLPTCLLSRLTSRHVTVALTGDGGDEIFGGYNRYVWAKKVWLRMQRFPAPIRGGGVKAVRSLSPRTWDSISGAIELLLPRNYRVRGAGDKLYKVADLFMATSEADLYRRLISIMQEPDKFCLVPGPTALPFELLSPPSALIRAEERMMFWDTQTYLPDDILVKLDRAAMRWGLEGRIPFLDNEVMRFGWRLPFDAKVAPGEGKRVVRKLLERHVPRELFNRPKTGFSIPIGVWLRGPLRAWAEDVLSASVLRQHIRPEPVRALWNEHLSGRCNNEHKLWSVLMLGCWLQHWESGKPVLQPRLAPVEIAPSVPPRRRGAVRGRVLFLINSLGGAGAEKQVVLSALSLAQQGFTAEIYTLSSERHSARLGSLLQQAEDAGVYVHKPEQGRNWLMESMIACRRSLRRDSHRILWTWGYRADLAAVTFFRGLTPRVSSLRSASIDALRRRRIWWKIFDRQCARYISNTWLNVEQLATILPGVEPRCRVLYNALEDIAVTRAAVELGVRPNRLEVVMLGNVRVRVKGYDLAVEVIRRLVEAKVPVRLRIAGLPFEGEDLKQRIAAANLGEACEFIGPVTDPFPFLQSANVFLLLSRFEGMPNALLEAMAVGLPCVATRVGDVSRFTQDRQHLWQLPIEDVAAATEALRFAWENWDLFKCMGPAARGLVAAQFSKASFEANVVSCIEDLIPDRKRASVVR